MTARRQRQLQFGQVGAPRVADRRCHLPHSDRTTGPSGLAVTLRGERDLNECRCRRRFVGSLTVPCNHQAVWGIDFDVAAGDHRPVEVKVERVSLAEEPS